MAALKETAKSMVPIAISSLTLALGIIWILGLSETAGAVTLEVLSQETMVHGDWVLAVRVTGNASNVNYSIDSGTLRPMACMEGGIYRATINVSALTDGNHSIVIIAHDTLDSSSLAAKTLSVVADNVAPTILNFHRDDGRNMVDGRVSGLVPFECTVIDANIATVNASLLIDGSPIEAVDLAPSGTGRDFAWTLDTFTCDNGLHNLSLVCTDGAGNGAALSWSLNVTNLPDLYIRYYNFDKENTDTGLRANLTLIVGNIGNVASGPFRISILEMRPGMLVPWSFDVRFVSSGLRPQEEIVVDYTWMPPSVNWTRIKIVVDPDDRVEEAPYGSNEVTIPLYHAGEQGDSCGPAILLPAILAGALVCRCCIVTRSTFPRAPPERNDIRSLGKRR